MPGSPEQRSLPGRISGPLLLLALIFAGWAVTRGFWNPLVDMHGFRQTQTALSVHTMLEGGPLIAYEIPVLGAPWRLPFEFPLYQWVVAGYHLLTRTPLDQSGRIVSLGFYLFALSAVWRLLAFLRWTAAEIRLSLAAIVLSPHFLFWPRTFLIETAALSFALWNLVISAELMVQCARGEKLRPAKAVAAIAAGSIAALVKITTFALIPLLAFALAALQRRFPDSAAEPADGSTSEAGATARMIKVLLLLSAIPVILGVAWSAAAGSIRGENPLADFTTGTPVLAWTFGTLAERLSWANWRFLLFRRFFPDLTGHALASSLLLFAVFVPARLRWSSALFVVGFFAPVLLFSHLFLAHNYYQSQNGFFLLLALSSIGTGLGRMGRPRLATAFFLCLFGTEVRGYLTGFYPWVEHQDERLVAFSRFLREGTAPDELLLIYGRDWSPELPYYAERRAIMDRNFRFPEDPAFVQAVERSGGRERIGAAVFCGIVRSHTGQMHSILEAIDIRDAEPIPGPECTAYLRHPFPWRSPSGSAAGLTSGGKFLSRGS